MKHTLTESDFVTRFLAVDNDSFTTQELEAIFNYFSDLEKDMGVEIEFDPIAIRCEFTAWKDIKDFNVDYGLDCETLEDVCQHTITIKTDTGFITQGF